jgi:hypothetical protein
MFVNAKIIKIMQSGWPISNAVPNREASMFMVKNGET